MVQQASFHGPAQVTRYRLMGLAESFLGPYFHSIQVYPSGAFCPSSNSAVGERAVRVEANVPGLCNNRRLWRSFRCTGTEEHQEQHSSQEGVNSHIADMWVMSQNTPGKNASDPTQSPTALVHDRRNIASYLAWRDTFSVRSA
jgi:hypothetical protein